MSEPRPDYAAFKAAQDISIATRFGSLEKESMQTNASAWSSSSTTYNYIGASFGSAPFGAIGIAGAGGRWNTVAGSGKSHLLRALQVVKILDANHLEVRTKELGALNKQEIISQIPNDHLEIKARLLELSEISELELNENSLIDFIDFLKFYNGIKTPYVFSTNKGNIKILWEDEPAEHSPAIDIEFIGGLEIVMGCVVVNNGDYEVSEIKSKVLELKKQIEPYGLWRWIFKNA